MNYKVLYRKYRPYNFDTIVGQEYIVKTLRNSIINNHISHAYIFSGPRGTGKTSTAKVFAKAINCLNQLNGSPCGECEFCKNFQGNPDIIEIDAASNNGVDEIRNLIDNIKLAPTNGKYKVYIIDEVHMLTVSAFNALLLTLEEPPAHAIFILATTNIENVPITILSRCQRYDFQKIAINDIVCALKFICEKENISIEEEALKEIAYLSDGGMRDSLSILDQLAKNNEKITLDFVEKQIKTISKKNIDDLIDTIEKNNVESFLNYVSDFQKRAVDYKTLVKKMIDGLSAKAKDSKKNLSFNRLSFSDYKNIITSLSESLNKINVNVDSYIIFQMILLEYFNLNIDSSSNTDDVENKTNLNTNIATKRFDSQFLSKLQKNRVNNCFVNAKKEYLEFAKNIINNLKNNFSLDGKIKSMLIDSNAVAASDSYIILTCNNDHTVIKANNMLSNIESVLNNNLGKEYKLIFLSNIDWNKEKTDYIKNIKLGIKYEYIEDEQVDNQNSEEVCDIFDLDKVEVV